MSNTPFVFEIYSEEIPPLDQLNAELKIFDLFCISLSQFAEIDTIKTKLEYKTFSTPNRLAIVIQNLPTQITIQDKELRGPSTTAPKQALNGFLASVNANITDLIEKNNYYFYIKKGSTIQTHQMLPQVCKSVIVSLSQTFEKLMYWNSTKEQWIRPIRSILCMFGDSTIEFESHGVRSSNITFGHKMLTENKITIHTPLEYEAKLKQYLVEPQKTERLSLIKQKITEIEKANNIYAIQDERLFSELSMICEHVNVLVSKIDRKFFSLPEQLIIETIKKNQRYILFRTQNGEFSDIFAIVCNIPTPDSKISSSIINGNLKVLNARLNDAMFFVSQDQKTPLLSRKESLKTVQFNEKLGSVYQRLERIFKVATSILNDTQYKITEQTLQTVTNLIKNDLTTMCVSEFASLQGYIGAFYAKAENYEPQIYNAIAEHYKPNFEGDHIPTSPLSVVISIADKLEKLISYFSIGIIPNSSKDPLALRRAGNGVALVIFENKLNINIKNTVISLYNDQSLALQIEQFICERIIFILKSKYQIDSTVLNMSNTSLIGREQYKYFENVQFLKSLCKWEHFEAFCNLYKRLSGITKSTNITQNSQSSHYKLSTQEEAISNLKLEQNLKSFEQALTTLDQYLNNTTINDEDYEVRAKRIQILLTLQNAIKCIANFDNLV